MQQPLPPLCVETSSLMTEFEERTSEEVGYKFEFEDVHSQRHSNSAHVVTEYVGLQRWHPPVSPVTSACYCRFDLLSRLVSASS